MRVWRICRVEHAAFDGEGGKTVSGRWHHRGLPVIYTANSLALAALELFVHLPPGMDLRRFVAIPVDIPKRLKVTHLDVSKLPLRWREPRRLESMRDIGMKWLRDGRTAVLAVPSAVIPVEHNYLLNPRHPHFRRIRVGAPQPFEFDSRMWKSE